MRYLVILGALCFWAAVSPARAQLQISAQTERSSFLLYERVDLSVTIANIGDTDILLDNNEGQPWLSFIVTMHRQHNYVPVHQERNSTFKGLTLKAGESKTLRVDLTPLYAFREVGDYQAAAVVDLPGQGQIVSQNVPFTVLPGRTVWTQMRPVDGSQRTYSLIRFSPTSSTTRLYLRVEGVAENVVYANLALGDIIAYIDPNVFFDPEGNLHVLNPFALGTYLYTRVNPDGKIDHQTVFKSVSIATASGVQRIPPRLRKLEDGSVTVAGGAEVDPNIPRDRLSDGRMAVKNPGPENPLPGTVQ